MDIQLYDTLWVQSARGKRELWLYAEVGVVDFKRPPYQGPTSLY